MTRGIRNCNPLNIVKNPANTWLGEITAQDKIFVTFSSMFWGARAAFILFRKYIQGYKLCHVDDFISRWAPPTENATERYISVVCQRTGFSLDYELVWTDAVDMVQLFQAMCFVENGQEIDEDDVTKAYFNVREHYD